MDLTQDELRNVFDFIELKRGEVFGCTVCGGNDWSARKAHLMEATEGGTKFEAPPYVELICKNCKQVLLFAPSILDGPW